MSNSTYDLARYTLREEIANAGTHGAGFVLSIIGLIAMVRYAVLYGDALHVVAVAVFGATLVTAYFSSTLYHIVTHPRQKHLCRLCDHACIYFLIAGTYTPFTMGMMRNGWGWALFGIVWALAVSGVVFKFISSHRFKNATVVIYLAMGWLAIVAVKPVIEAMPPGCFTWVVLGGLMYTGGVVFYLWRKLPYNHAIWHLFVMAGSFSHFVAVYWYVLPDSPDMLAMMAH